MTSHSRSYGEELQRSIFVQIASAIGDLESVIGITPKLIADIKQTITLMEGVAIESLLAVDILPSLKEGGS